MPSPYDSPLRRRWSARRQGTRPGTGDLYAPPAAVAEAYPKFVGRRAKAFHSECRSHLRAALECTPEAQRYLCAARADSSTRLFDMAQKLHPARCAECEQLRKDYADASLKRVRACGNLKLANLRSDSETMEMLGEAAVLAAQKLEEVKKKIREHDSARH